MNRHERRKATRMRVPVYVPNVRPCDVVDNALHGANDVNVAVGPLTWQPSDGTAGRVWYFLIATSEARRGFRVDQVTVNGESEMERQRVLVEFTQRRPPLVIHSFDDELDMARWCEKMWPGERITKIRNSIEQERKQWSEKRP